MYSGGFMRNTTTLLIGLSTLLLFFSTHGIPLVNAQSAGPNDQNNNDNSASQTQNSDPFAPKGSDNNINTGSDNSQSQTSDGSSSSTNDKSSDGSSSNNHDDNKKGSDDSKSSDHKDSRTKHDLLPFP